MCHYHTRWGKSQGIQPQEDVQVSKRIDKELSAGNCVQSTDYHEERSSFSPRMEEAYHYWQTCLRWSVQMQRFRCQKRWYLHNDLHTWWWNRANFMDCLQISQDRWCRNGDVQHYWEHYWICQVVSGVRALIEVTVIPQHKEHYPKEIRWMF